jgi:hypothetical protein
MSDNSKYFDEGNRLARKAESGDLVGTNKELAEYRAKMTAADYKQLLKSMEGANTVHVLNDKQEVDKYNKSKWFFQSEQKPTVPNLIITDNKNHKPMELAGIVLKDAELPGVQKATESPKDNNKSQTKREDLILPWSPVSAEKVWRETLNTSNK